MFTPIPLLGLWISSMDGIFLLLAKSVIFMATSQKSTIHSNSLEDKLLTFQAIGGFGHQPSAMLKMPGTSTIKDLKATAKSPTIIS